MLVIEVYSASEQIKTESNNAITFQQKLKSIKINGPNIRTDTSFNQAAFIVSICAAKGSCYKPL